MSGEYVTEPDDSEISILLDRLKDQPDDRAVEKIWNRYYGQLITYARRKLRNVPLRDFDEEDVVSEALNTFFKDVRRDRYPQLTDRNDLWRILLVLTLRKVLQNIRATKAAKRGGGNVRGDSIFVSATEKGAGFDKLPGKATTQTFAEKLTMEMQEQLDGLGEDSLKQIGIMKLQGFTNQEVADTLQVSERTVERKLERIRNHWKKSV